MSSARRTRGPHKGLALVVLLGAAGSPFAQEPVSPKLTPKLQQLLLQEMVAIHDASQQVLAALISGENARVAELAQQIHDSFILDQAMTQQDRQDLLAAVPDEFVQMDQSLHELAADLARAAREENQATQHELFARMLETCSACHASYATDRFPAFSE